MIERYERMLKLKGVRNADVCRATGISPATISEWRKGKYELNLDRIVMIAEFLGVSLDYFVLGKERETSELMLLYGELNDEGKELLRDRASELIKLGYIKSDKSEMVGA